jgi:hypothetical protein
MFSSLGSIQSFKNNLPWSIFSASLIASATSGNTGYALCPYYEICMSDSTQYIFYIDINRRAWLSNDYGVTWSNLFSNATTPRGMGCSTTGQYLVVGTNSSTIYYSSDYGASFKTLTTSGGPSATANTAIKISDDGKTVMVGTGLYTGMYLTKNADAGTQTWTRYTTSIRLYSCTMSSNGINLFYFADGTNYYTSYDAGTTWTTETWPASANSAYKGAGSNDMTCLIANCWNGQGIGKIFFSNDYPTTKLADINTGDFLKVGNLSSTGQFFTILCSKNTNTYGKYTIGIFENASSNSFLYSVDSGVSFQRFGTTPFANGSGFTFGCISSDGKYILMSSSGGNNSLYKITFV